MSVIGDESQYYVSISRATQHAVLYTDDAQRLPQAFSREDAKAAALSVQCAGVVGLSGARGRDLALGACVI